MTSGDQDNGGRDTLARGNAAGEKAKVLCVTTYELGDDAGQALEEVVKGVL